jgi:hypothetical protein
MRTGTTGASSIKEMSSRANNDNQSIADKGIDRVVMRSVPEESGKLLPTLKVRLHVDARKNVEI